MRQEITPRSLEIANYYLTHPTLTYQQLGEHFGISKGRISVILSNPRVTKHFPLLARKRVQSHLLPKALERYEKIIEHSDNDAVAEKAAGRVLASENVFDGPKITIQNDLTIKTVQELRQIVVNAVAIDPNLAMDAEVIEEKASDTTQDTIHP